jgi:hypothetical protein
MDGTICFDLKAPLSLWNGMVIEIYGGLPFSPEGALQKACEFLGTWRGNLLTYHTILVLNKGKKIACRHLQSF